VKQRIIKTKETSKMRNVDNTEDLIDTRDLIRLIEDIEGDFEVLTKAVDEVQEVYDEMLERIEELGEHEDDTPEREKLAEYASELEEAQKALAEWDDADELKSLQAFAKQVEDYCTDYLHGETLIRESYFTDYVEELVKDCYGLPSDLPSFIVIDWEATAENVKQDYSEADFDGVTYYFR